MKFSRSFLDTQQRAASVRFCYKYSFPPRLSISNVDISCKNDATNLSRNAPVPADRQGWYTLLPECCNPNPPEPLSTVGFFFSVTAESVRIQWSRHQLLSKWMLGREGRGVLFAMKPLLSRLLPLLMWFLLQQQQQPLSASQSTYVCVSELSNNETASPTFCHVITPPTSLSFLFRLFTLMDKNLASLIHFNSCSITAFFICLHLDSLPTNLYWFPDRYF